MTCTPEASRDVETLTRDISDPSLTLPLVSNGRVFGGLALVTTAQGGEWPSELIQQLRLMAKSSRACSAVGRWSGRSSRARP